MIITFYVHQRNVPNITSCFNTTSCKIVTSKALENYMTVRTKKFSFSSRSHYSKTCAFHRHVLHFVN